MGKRRKTGNKKNISERNGNKNDSQEGRQSINSLPPEVLTKIFGYLSPRDRLRLERVCKHCKLMAQQSWQTINHLWISASRKVNEKKENHLTFNGQYRYLLKTDEEQRVLQKVTTLCGNFVKTIRLQGDVGLKTYALIRNRCPNITGLILFNFETSISTRVLVPLFRRCTLLKSLIINRCDLEMFSVLRQLPIENLTEFIILRVDGDCSPSATAPVLEKLKSVRYFVFPIHPTLMRTIPMKMNLDFPFGFHTVSKGLNLDLAEVFDVMDLTNLDFVNLTCSDIDDFAVKLAASCKKLKSISIGGDNYITETGLNAISTLPKLIHVNISSHALTDEILVKFIQVSAMVCTGCDALTVQGYIALIKSSENLKTLIIDYKESETEELLKAAIKITKDRPRKRNLSIGVSLAPGGLVAQFNNKSDYLEVYLENNFF